MVVGLISNNDDSAYREEVNQLVVWCDKNNLSLNVNKTKEITVDFRRKHMRLYREHPDQQPPSVVWQLHRRRPVVPPESEKPKPTVRVDPQSSVYTGDTVTLICEVESTGWEFLWYKNSQLLQPQNPADKNTNTISVTVSDAGTAEFRCRAHRGDYSTQDSDPVKITVRERPKATVKIQPADHVFIGETVTLTCDIDSGGYWWYHWYKGENVFSYSQRRKKYTISKVAQSHSGVYTCEGTQSANPRYSQTSDAVTLTVSEKPKPTVRVDPQSSVYTGATVTLICEVESTGWEFLWYKNSQPLRPQNPADKDTNTIRVTVSDEGTAEFRCRARRGNYQYYDDYYKKYVYGYHTKFSGPAIITIGESGGGWQYEWFKNNTPIKAAPGTNKYNISSVAQSHNGVYTCNGTQSTDPRYSQTSDAVTLTVSEKPKPELTSSHKGAALIGNPVVLYCRLDQSAGWKFYWFKHSQNPENEIKTETHSYTISSVSVSDGGQYWCRAGRGDPVYYTHYSDALWMNTTEVRASFSVLCLLSCLMAASPYVLVTIVLVVKFYRAQDASAQSLTEGRVPARRRNVHEQRGDESTRELQPLIEPVLRRPLLKSAPNSHSGKTALLSLMSTW
ncbi:carcinoembryonic antigen-related cell adhesion molecule 5-like [Colossoma macropomum]|uniref:carcinoembryonic antigen-related cell adhesion molecule 5-like n=1 Tax=Colossoma macropomum TaxID=42526 RepID=UPI001863C895|nr:carcinoembryonic antigen-related cell adhesion molecule 5-like [Colossoma macropomum]